MLQSYQRHRLSARCLCSGHPGEAIAIRDSRPVSPYSAETLLRRGLIFASLYRGKGYIANKFPLNVVKGTFWEKNYLKNSFLSQKQGIFEEKLWLKIVGISKNSKIPPGKIKKSPKTVQNTDDGGKCDNRNTNSNHAP